MKLLIVQSMDGVDIVLIAIDDEKDRAKAVDKAADYADFRGEVYISGEIELPPFGVEGIEPLRPFVG